jgi:drug/metabolite transporter (DMT)-like permease
MAWHERKYAGAMLRLAGLMLLAFAGLIGRRLFLAADPTATVRATAYLFALIFMASACAGAALAVLGRHLFDQVELPARWRIHVHPPSARLRGRDPD